MDKLDERIITLVNEGKTGREISEDLFISISSIRRRLKILNLQTKTSIEKKEKPFISKENLEILIGENLSMRQISKKTGKSLTSIRYWFKKYKLVQNNTNIYELTGKKKCSKCKIEKNIENFYKRRGVIFGSTYCKDCTNRSTVERMNLFKSRCVEYKGGCCQSCGYNKYNGALEFHHLNPLNKDFTISHMKSYSFDDIVKSELDKCVLLCANCHREVENGIKFVAPPRIELGITD